MTGPTLPDADLAALQMRMISRAYDQLRGASDKLLSAQRRGAAVADTVPLMQDVVVASHALRAAAYASLLAYGLDNDMTFPSIIEGTTEEDTPCEAPSCA